MRREPQALRLSRGILRRRTLCTLGGVGALLTVLSGCTIISTPPAGKMRIVCNVPNATVWIDDVFVGRTGDWAKGKLVRVGFHRIELRHPDHYSHFAEVNVKELGEGLVQGELRPQLE